MLVSGRVRVFFQQIQPRTPAKPGLEYLPNPKKLESETPPPPKRKRSSQKKNAKVEFKPIAVAFFKKTFTLLITNISHLWNRKTIIDSKGSLTRGMLVSRRVHPRSLTARPWKMIGKNFRGELLNFQECNLRTVLDFHINFFDTSLQTFQRKRALGAVEIQEYPPTKGGASRRFKMASMVIG